MEQTLEIKAKYSKGDYLFALKEGVDREPNCLIPVKITGISSIKILTGMNLITYSATTTEKKIGLEVNEINLYTAEQLKTFLK